MIRRLVMIAALSLTALVAAQAQSVKPDATPPDPEAKFQGCDEVHGP